MNLIHRVHALPEEGQYARTKCGFKTNRPSELAVRRSDIPAGERFCRKCWKEDAATTNPTKLLLVEDVARAATNGLVPAEILMAILQDRYYPEDNNRSPKAA